MRLFFSVLAVLFFAQAGYSQLHQDVLPGEQGTSLLDHLEASYKPATVLSYKEARNEMFGDIDNINDSIYCVYTNDRIYLNHNASDPKGKAYSSGFNTEHTFPQSQGATGSAKSDLHHLFPTRVDVNGARGHLPFDDIPDNVTDTWYYLDGTSGSIPNSFIDEYSELDKNHTFEPREAHKGNVARAMMYFYTMYEDQTTAGYFSGMIPTLCAWHYEDAVDQREWDRTWAIADAQGKPNPFVLDCTLAERSYCSGMGSVCNPDAVGEVSNISLFGVIPNPVSLTAKIRMNLERASVNAKVFVYDMMGNQRFVKELHHLVAGPNEVYLDVSDWESGFYIYAIQVDGDWASGKLVVF